MKKITWESKKVKVSELKEIDSNHKIFNEVGYKRFSKSVELFGLAGTIVCNLDLTIIDGHSRAKKLQQLGVEEVWVSVPDRMLTEKELKDFNAVFDLSRAGDPNMTMIEEMLTEEMQDDFFIDKHEKIVPREIELKPYKRTHVLLSFPPEKMIDIQEYLQKISEFDFVEYEQANN